LVGGGWVGGITGEGEAVLFDEGSGEEALSGSSVVLFWKASPVEGLHNKARARGGLSIGWEA